MSPSPGAAPLVIHTDGACHGNPGPGGWGAWWQSPTGPVELMGGEPATTNNRMEMAAVLQALALARTLAPGTALLVRSDSQYVIHGITQWRRGWERRNWRAASGAPVKNAPLWRALFAQVDACGPRLGFEWVRGHNGDAGNERADALAQEGLALARTRRSIGAWCRQAGALSPHQAPACPG